MHLLSQLTLIFLQEKVLRMTPDVDLVDGAQLCDLLKKHRLGVAAEERVVEDVTLDEDFFTGL